MTPATSLGFSAVAFATDVLGIPPLPWQRWLMIHALELRPGGRFRFRTILLLVARQNGKTSIIEVKNLWKMFVLGVRLVICTAQDLDTAEESWDKAVEIVESLPELDAMKAHVDKTNGKKALKLLNGSRWKIVSSSRRGGRGKPGDDVNLDELREHLDWLSWAAVTKTTMARPNAQIWAFSNAGDDRSIVLNDLQAKGRATVEHPELDPTFGHFEWSVPDHVKCTCRRVGAEPHSALCQLRDRTFWAMANPAYGYTITEEALESALGTDPDEIFITECLCRRVPNLVPAQIPEPIWQARADPDSQLVGRPAFAIDSRPDRSATTIGAFGKRADGKGHVEIIENRPGTGWTPERMVELARQWDPVVVVVCPSAPAGAFVRKLNELGFVAEPDPGQWRLMLINTTEAAQAAGAFYDDVIEEKLVHLDDQILNDAVKGATKRDLSAGAWLWDWKDASVDISPLVAVTNAKHGYAAWGHINEQEEIDGPLGA